MLGIDDSIDEIDGASALANCPEIGWPLTQPLHRRLQGMGPGPGASPVLGHVLQSLIYNNSFNNFSTIVFLVFLILEYGLNRPRACHSHVKSLGGAVMPILGYVHYVGL